MLQHCHLNWKYSIATSIGSRVLPPQLGVQHSHLNWKYSIPTSIGSTAFPPQLKVQHCHLKDIAKRCLIKIPHKVPLNYSAIKRRKLLPTAANNSQLGVLDSSMYLKANEKQTMHWSTSGAVDML